jgi:hypothetical protein
METFIMSQPSVWDYRDNLDYDLPLDPGDRRLVPLNDARGNFSEDRILKAVGVDPATDALRWRPDRLYVLFGGHRGCGKSTELRRLAGKLAGPERYFVVFIDALAELDVHNLRYSDILLAQAKALVTELEEQQIAVEPVFLTRLSDWFAQRVEQYDKTRDLAAEIKAGAKAETGLPWLGKLFAELTNSVRLNSTYKEEVRTVVRNHFAELADGFNQLIARVNELVSEHGLGQRVLFVIDGTDRLSGQDQQHFFVRDIHQLRLIESNFIYCAPIDLLTEEGQLRQNFDEVFRLPMVKLASKGATDPDPDARKLLQDFVFNRIPAPYFDHPDTVDFLIDHCGGHPRDLLRLLNYSFQDMGGDCFDRLAADSAVRRLATDYKRLLEPGDYRLLAEIDGAEEDYTPVSEETRRLLYNLALLEYNSFWWQTHPVVRTLRAYRDARAAIEPGR